MVCPGRRREWLAITSGEQASCGRPSGQFGGVFRKETPNSVIARPMLAYESARRRNPASARDSSRNWFNCRRRGTAFVCRRGLLPYNFAVLSLLQCPSRPACGSAPTKSLGSLAPGGEGSALELAERLPAKANPYANAPVARLPRRSARGHAEGVSVSPRWGWG